MSDVPSTIRVAILGGGVAGIALLRGLLRYPHIAADIYEPRPTFKESGLGLVLVQGIEDILRAIDPALDRCLDSAGAVDSVTEIRLATGPDAGKKINTKGFWASTQRTVGQQAFLDELLKGLPPRMVHTNTRPASITELPYSEGVELAFADGSQKKYDVVIGADGIHGITRKHVLGADDPALEPQHTRVWGLPIKIPLSKAQEAMGEEYIDPETPTQVVWVGDGNMMQHHLQDGGKEVHISTYIRRDDDDSAHDNTWARLFSPGEFSAAFAKNELQVCRGMVDLIQDIYTFQLPGISQMQHRPARTYATQRTALVGDAAHAMHLSPGASAALGLEEALVLSALLGRTASREAVPAALLAFDRVCRPRAERGVRHSAECGLLLTGRKPGVGLDPGLIAQHLGGKWDFLLDPSAEALRAAAANAMDRILSEGGWRY
ncbi:hypothetical protein F4809DRAFT_664472 [Biscogniauxia mediterranea]|nr:hypothetical protein F4809DRAFT_664472 [Biscogniauxia mediterranea]